MQSIILLSVTYTECHIQALYAERLYAECRYVECRVLFRKTDNAPI